MEVHIQILNAFWPNNSTCRNLPIEDNYICEINIFMRIFCDVLKQSIHVPWYGVVNKLQIIEHFIANKITVHVCV